MSAKVGQDIESICGKCGDVWHVVVALEGSKIAKVQCKQCGGYHRHRPPGGQTKPARSASSRRTAKRKPKEPEGPQVQADPSRPPKAYRIDQSFEAGDTVEHRTFGTGVVEQILEDRKIQVFFPGGRRVLAHQR